MLKACNLKFSIWVVPKIRVLFWYPNIVGAVLESLPKKGPYYLIFLAC